MKINDILHTRFNIFQDFLHNFSFWSNSPSWALWVLRLWCKSGKFTEKKCYIRLVHLHFDNMTSLQNGLKTKIFCCTRTHFTHIFLHSLGLRKLKYAIITAVLYLKSYYFHRQIGRPENRYRIQILVGYGIPLLFIILTGIVEATGPVCSKWRPRFNEQSCFFSGYYFIFQIFLGCTS